MDSTGQRPYFFISYAHDQGDGDRYVSEFYRALSADVALYSGEDSREHVGFCDTTFRAGDQWSSALVRALRTCQVFLPLCSPTYFKRPACGKEWTIFAERLAGLERTGHQPAPSLIPLFWVPMPMPKIGHRYQYRDPAFGEAYDKSGLRDLVRLSSARDDYQRFVGALAERIVYLVERYEIPPHPRRPEFDAVPAAFPAAFPSAGRRLPDQPGPDPIPQRVARGDEPLADQDLPRPILNQNDK